MRAREHKGSFDDSMATVVEIEGTMVSLLDYVKRTMQWPEDHPISITVTPYAYDHRNCWDTHIVTIVDYGVFGYTDQLPR